MRETGLVAIERQSRVELDAKDRLSFDIPGQSGADAGIKHDRGDLTGRTVLHQQGYGKLPAVRLAVDSLSSLFDFDASRPPRAIRIEGCRQ